ncbi:MAG: oligosaccharide flippase family protein [Lachnospiraceae bacterium]|nr:oligosaccharide flippase family protein [Lachnospiraceae bacterium]
MILSRKIKSKYDEMPLRVKASGWFFICSLLQKAISVLSTAVFTRLMSTDDYGLISIYNSWSDIFMIFASLNLAVGCFNVGMTKYENDRKNWVSSLQVLSVIATALFDVVFIATYPLWGKLIDIKFNYVLIMAITFFTIPALNLWTSRQRYECSYRKLVWISIGYSILVFLLSFICVIFSDNKGAAKIYSTSFVSIVIGFGLLISNISKDKPIAKKDYVRFAASYNMQMMPAFLATVILNQIDRVMIDRMVGRDAAGIYSVAYNAAYMISIVASAINATYNPWLMKKVKDNNYEKVDKIGISITEVLLIIIFAFIFCAPEFVKIIASNDYYEAIYIIPAVAGSTFFSLVYTLYCPIAQYYLKVRQLASVTVISALLNILLNYLAIAEWGYIAAGYTTYICYLIYGWGTGVYAIRLLKQNKINSTIYRTGKLIALTVILTVVTVIAPFLYNGYLIRYSLFVCSIVFIVLTGKKYISLFADIKKG